MARDFLRRRRNNVITEALALARALGQRLGRELRLRLWLRLSVAPGWRWLRSKLGLAAAMPLPRTLLRPVLPRAGAGDSSDGDVSPERFSAPENATPADEGYGSDSSYERFLARIAEENAAAEAEGDRGSDSDASLDRFLAEVDEAAGLEPLPEAYDPFADEAAGLESMPEGYNPFADEAGGLESMLEAYDPFADGGDEAPLASPPTAASPSPEASPERLAPAAADVPGPPPSANALERGCELAALALRRSGFANHTPLGDDERLRWALGRRVDLRECTTLPPYRKHPSLAPGALPAPGEEPFGEPLLQEFSALPRPPVPALAHLPRSGPELHAFYEALARPRPGLRRLPLTYAGDFHRAQLLHQRSSWVEYLFGHLDRAKLEEILSGERRRAVRELVLAGDDPLRRQAAATPSGGYSAFNERTLLELRRFHRFNHLSEPLAGRLPGGRGLREMLPPELQRVGYQALPDNNLWLSQANHYQRSYLWEWAAGDAPLPPALEYLVDYTLTHYPHL